MAPIGKPPPRPLAMRDGVGRMPGVLEGEEAAGPPGAALHLVDQEEQVVLVAEPAQPDQELRRAGVDAAVALDRLDEDGRGVRRRPGPAKLCQVVQLAERRSRARSGRKPFCTLSFGVALIPPNIRPWKAFFAQTTLKHLPSTPRLPDAVEPRELEQGLVRLARRCCRRRPGPGPRSRRAGARARPGSGAGRGCSCGSARRPAAGRPRPSAGGSGRAS